MRYYGATYSPSNTNVIGSLEPSCKLFSVSSSSCNRRTIFENLLFSFFTHSNVSIGSCRLAIVPFTRLLLLLLPPPCPPANNGLMPGNNRLLVGKVSFFVIVTSHRVSWDGVTIDPVPNVASSTLFSMPSLGEGIAREAILDAIRSIMTMYISKSLSHSFGNDGRVVVTPCVFVVLIVCWWSSVELSVLVNASFTLSDDC
mmetsp:Transcript_31390/g.57483  ORF Transcript_31390/g.57483 Transcript_31390/m.57483 type:complete len:200 (+) Transcript_31390:831-1430(+)